MQRCFACWLRSDITHVELLLTRKCLAHKCPYRNDNGYVDKNDIHRLGITHRISFTSMQSDGAYGPCAIVDKQHSAESGWFFLSLKVAKGVKRQLEAFYTAQFEGTYSMSKALWNTCVSSCLIVGISNQQLRYIAKKKRMPPKIDQAWICSEFVFAGLVYTNAVNSKAEPASVTPEAVWKILSKDPNVVHEYRDTIVREITIGSLSG